MTNIMALVYNGEIRAEKAVLFDNSFSPAQIRQRRCGVVMSDGLSSGGGEVEPGNQKVVAIGANYLLGTGLRLHINLLGKHMQRHKALPPKQLGQELIRTARRLIDWKETDRLNFIVAGRNLKREFEVYQIILNSINEPLPVGSYALDGSGSEFTRKALDRENTLGIITMPSRPTIADLTSKLYDLGYEATRSAGVNDQFQFGFMTPYGNAALFNPRILLSAPPKEYCGRPGKIDPRKVARNKAAYEALYAKLEELFCKNLRYNNAMSDIRNNHREMPAHAPEHMNGLLGDIHQLKTDINSIIMDYVRSHNPPKTR